MGKTVVLDSGIVGLVTHPKKQSPVGQACKSWLDQLPLRDYEVVLPEIIDYEVRRELLRAGKSAGLRRLDQLKASVTYNPITTTVMLKAAQLWADSRKRGQPTADPKALDIDVILAASALILAETGHEVIVATTNIKHLSQFVDAREWEDI